MDTYEIPVETVQNAFRQPYKTQALDEDGAGMVEKDEKGEPVLVDVGNGRKVEKPVLTDATTPLLIRTALANIPRSITRGDDSLRIPQVFNRVDAATEVVTLKEKHYLWLHRLLERKVPLTPADIEANGKISNDADKVQPVTYAWALWGANEEVFKNYLRPVSERKNLDEE